jgi:hypothetical protein
VEIVTEEEASKLTECFTAVEKEITKIASFYDVRLVLASLMEMSSRLAAATVKHNIYTIDQVAELFVATIVITTERESNAKCLKVHGDDVIEGTKQ